MSSEKKDKSNRNKDSVTGNSNHQLDPMFKALREAMVMANDSVAIARQSGYNIFNIGMLKYLNYKQKLEFHKYLECYQTEKLKQIKALTNLLRDPRATPTALLKSHTFKLENTGPKIPQDIDRKVRKLLEAIIERENKTIKPRP